MGVVSRMWVAGCGWTIWVWLVGVVVRRYIDFLILLIPTHLVYICSFLQQQPYFLFIFKKVFCSCIYITIDIILMI